MALTYTYLLEKVEFNGKRLLLLTNLASDECMYYTSVQGIRDGEVYLYYGHEPHKFKLTSFHNYINLKEQFADCICPTSFVNINDFDIGSLTVESSTAYPIPMCRLSDNKRVFVEVGKDSGGITYTDLDDGSNPVDLSGYDVIQITDTPQIITLGKDTIEVSSIKGETRYKDLDTNNFLTKNEFLDMAKKYARININPPAKFNNPADAEVKTILTGATDVQAILAPRVAAYAASIVAKNPELTAADLKICKVSVNQLPNKRPIFDDVAGAAAVVSNENQIDVVFTNQQGDVLTDMVFYGDSAAEYGNELDLTDDCVCYLDGCEVKAADLVLTPTVDGAGVSICFELACFRTN